MRTHNAISEYKKSNTAADRIHFLNTAASDAILIESCGKFALIDCAEDNDCKKVGENDRSLGILLEKDGTRIFLAGDIDNFSSDEKRLAPQIGKINLLKVGHHSYAGSTSVCWLKTLKPDTCIITNRHKGADKKTCFKIKLIARSDIFVTGTENGVIAEVHKNGRIDYFSNIHK